MADKRRNFRASYYDKMGFRGVEEKRELEILINEKPMDKEKLSKFCLRFTLPQIYREYVWEVLLGVLSINTETHSMISCIRQEQYKDFEDALNIMCCMKENTPKSVAHTLMFLMVEDVLEFDTTKQLSSPKVQNLVALASLFLELSSTEVVAFWIFRYFVLNQRKISYHYKTLRESLENILRKEDETLLEHLKSIKAFDVLPVDLWFGRCLADVLHESSLARICDKVIGGSCRILPYAAAALLMVRKHLLLPLNDSNKIIDILEKSPEDISDMAVNKALDLYYTASH